MPLPDLEVSGKLGTLQLMDDAIAFRLGQLQRPCLDCTSRLRCDEHAFDQHLLEMYRARYAAAWAEAFAGLDPAVIDQLMQADDVPPTVAILGAAVAARLRKAAAGRPFVVELDGQPVVIELDGQPPAGHRLPAGHDGHPEPPGYSKT